MNDFERLQASVRPVTIPKYGVWSKTLCKLGIHIWDTHPKGLRLCTQCEKWDAMTWFNLTACNFGFHKWEHFRGDISICRRCSMWDIGDDV